MKPLRTILPLALLLLLCGLVAVGVVTRKQESERSVAGTGEADTHDHTVVPDSDPAFADVPKTDTAPAAFSNAARGAAASVPPAVLAVRMGTRSDDLPIITHPDGRRSVRLEGRFTHMSAVVRGTDGRDTIQCFSSHQALVSATSGMPSPAATQPSEQPR